MSDAVETVDIDVLAGLVHQLRGQRVLLDSDLAELYGIETRLVVRAVRRHLDRFPADFMFQLSTDEALRSQIGISNGRDGRRYLPYAFTEQRVAMLSSVLNSPRAVQVNIEIMRAFVALRRMVAAYDELSERLDGLESKYDEQFRDVFAAIRAWMAPPPAQTRKLGFREEEAVYTAAGSAQ